MVSFFTPLYWNPPPQHLFPPYVWYCILDFIIRKLQLLFFPPGQCVHPLSVFYWLMTWEWLPHEISEVLRGV